jgi:hypothetical protein
MVLNCSTPEDPLFVIEELLAARAKATSAALTVAIDAPGTIAAWRTFSAAKIASSCNLTPVRKGMDDLRLSR